MDDVVDGFIQAHGEEKRGYDRRIKDLEMRLNSVLSAKSRDDEEHASRVKVCTHFRLYRTLSGRLPNCAQPLRLPVAVSLHQSLATQWRGQCLGVD